MITWKEKVSMFGMKAIMRVVVGCSILVKPALSVVESYKKRWCETGENKEFFARLKHVFDYTDLPLPDATKTEIGGDEIDDLRDIMANLDKTVKDKVKMPYLKSDTWPEPITLTTGYLQVNPLVSTPVVFETQKDIKKAKTANKKKPNRNRKSTMKKPDSKTPRGKKK